MRDAPKLAFNVRPILGVAVALAALGGWGVVRHVWGPGDPAADATSEANPVIPAHAPANAVEAPVPTPITIVTASPERNEAPERPPVTSIRPAAASAKLVVAIQGAVFRPGVYEFPPGARVQALLDRGGVSAQADLREINPAALLVDATTLVVPTAGSAAPNSRDALLNPPEYTRWGWRRPEPASATVFREPSPAATSSQEDLIDLNSADARALETLPGIGPKTAAKIIEYRENLPFRSVDDLLSVPGMGEKRVEAIRALVRAD